jgi:hypothetical protein
MSQLSIRTTLTAKLIALASLAIWVCCLSATIRAAEPSMSSAFTGEKVEWHGFDRYDFVMDEQTLAITPLKAPADEGFGVKAPEKSQRRCIIVVPKEAAPGQPKH